MAATVLFIMTILASLLAFGNRNLKNRFMFRPYQVVHNKKWHLLLTSGFIHNDLMHLVFNMLTFYFFAFSLESTIGITNFIIIYLGSMILSHIPTLLRHKNDWQYCSLGASGAISGILFSSIVIYPTNKIMMMPIPIPLPSAVFGVAYLVWCKFAARYSQDNINHDAHFAGAISGVILSFMLFGKDIVSIWKELLTFFNN